MLEISGIGNEKLSRYGESFLNEISCFRTSRE
jgi:superfamily II DNA helicase RecQ